MRIFAQQPQVPQQAILPKPAIFGRAHFGQNDGVNLILHLQRTIGNRAVQRLLEANAEEFAASSAGTASTPLGRASAAGPLQTKLTINKPGNEYEQEADRVTEQVMGMPSQLGGGPVTQGAGRDEHLPSNSMARAITPLVQAKGSERATASDEVTDQIASTRGGGSPLPESSRSFMESRFGTDFSQVRIHTGDYAAQLSTDLNAKAFTVGRDIYFNRNFSPDSSEGRSLLAHELTHTVQQGAVSSSPAAAQLMIQKADGDKATTHFGEFEAVSYHALKRKSDGKEVGVDMFLKFKPGPKVDAKQIALTQAANSILGGTSLTALVPNVGRRSATSAVGLGQHIDVLPGFPSPLYSTKDMPRGGADASKLTSYPTEPSTVLTPAEVTAQETATDITGETRTGFGKHGFRFMDAGALKGPESAELYDSPRLGIANDSEQVFESTALAIEGTQTDTYYGSVNWGWKRDTAGKFSILPFKAVSQGTPSVNFLTAATIWNTATEDFNWGVSTATANILDATDITKTKAAVTKGTALTFGGAHFASGGATYNLVTVKDGLSKGTAGVINSTEMALMDVGRATVKLPVAEVYTTNTAGAWMVSDPAKAAGTIVSKLAKGTRVTIVPDIIVQGVAAAAGIKIDPAWALIKVVDGPDIDKQGWVTKTLLTREALGTH